MDYHNNNYLQPNEFRYLNQYIFKYKIIDIKKIFFLF